MPRLNSAAVYRFPKRKQSQRAPSLSLLLSTCEKAKVVSSDEFFTVLRDTVSEFSGDPIDTSAESLHLPPLVGWKRQSKREPLR